MTAPHIDEFEVEYARFNALKTLSTDTPSAFEHTRFGPLRVTRDRARPDAYYNRVLGLTPTSVGQLDDAIAWIEHGTAAVANVRIDVSHDHTAVDTRLNSYLTARGFSHADTLVWLHLPDQQDDPAATNATEIPATTVRELTPHDWQSIQRNREHEWPIDDRIWKQKRSYLCTDTFRWFGIFEDDELVSTASTWTIATSSRSDAANVTILGSAFTLPQYRNLGHQRQLLEARRRLVPGPLYVDVAPESSSYRNCVRAGFRDLDHRQVWTRQTSL